MWEIILTASILAIFQGWIALSILNFIKWEINRLDATLSRLSGRVHHLEIDVLNLKDKSNGE